MGLNELGGEISTLPSRVAPFALVSGLFAVEPPGKPGGKDLGMPAGVGVVREGSNPDLIGVWSFNGPGLNEFPSSLAVLVRLKVGFSNPDAPFIVGNPEMLGSFWVGGSCFLLG